MECCGLDRDSNFCPDCGRKLNEFFGLKDLHIHCMKYARTLNKRIEETKGYLEKCPERKKDERYMHVFRLEEKALDKWNNWVSILAKIVAKENKKKKGEK